MYECTRHSTTCVGVRGHFEESLLFLPWVTDIEPRSSGLVANGFTCWAILPAPGANLLIPGFFSNEFKNLAKTFKVKNLPWKIFFLSFLLVLENSQFTSCELCRLGEWEYSKPQVFISEDLAGFQGWLSKTIIRIVACDNGNCYMCCLLAMRQFTVGFLVYK